jgi:hypothetical protein
MVLADRPAQSVSISEAPYGPSCPERNSGLCLGDAGLAAKVCPMAFESFERHLLGGVRFSDEELAALKRLLAGDAHGLSGKEAERFKMKLEEGRQV